MDLALFKKYIIILFTTASMEKLALTESRQLWDHVEAKVRDNLQLAEQPALHPAGERLTWRDIRLLEFLCQVISPKTVVQTYQFFLGDTPHP